MRSILPRYRGVIHKGRFTHPQHGEQVISFRSLSSGGISILVSSRVNPKLPELSGDFLQLLNQNAEVLFPYTGVLVVDHPKLPESLKAWAGSRRAEEQVWVEAGKQALLKKGFRDGGTKHGKAWFWSGNITDGNCKGYTKRDLMIIGYQAVTQCSPSSN